MKEEASWYAEVGFQGATFLVQLVQLLCSWLDALSEGWGHLEAARAP